MTSIKRCQKAVSLLLNCIFSAFYRKRNLGCFAPLLQNKILLKFGNYFSVSIRTLITFTSGYFFIFYPKSMKTKTPRSRYTCEVFTICFGLPLSRNDNRVFFHFVDHVQQRCACANIKELYKTDRLVEGRILQLGNVGTPSNSRLRFPIPRSLMVHDACRRCLRTDF